MGGVPQSSLSGDAHRRRPATNLARWPAVVLGAVLYAACSTSVQHPRPSAHAQQVSVAEDATLQLTLGESDTDGTEYRVIAQPAYGTLSGTGATRIYRPAADYFGADQLQFVVMDEDGTASAAATISITVTPVNDAPVADAGDDQSADTGSMVTVIGTATDVDDTEASLRYAWSQLAAAPAGAPALDLAPSDRAELTFAAPSVAAVYLLQLRVDDPAGAHSTDTVRLRIGGDDSTAPPFSDLSPPNQSPVARAQQLVVAEDATLEITLGGSDSDGGLVAYEVILQPVHGTLSGTGATRIYRPSADYFGADQLQFVVIDDDGAASAAETISITVTPVNDAPVADGSRRGRRSIGRYRFHGHGHRHRNGRR